VGREINLSDRLRFLKSYVSPKRTDYHLVPLARTIQKRTIELLQQDYLRGRITSVYTDALYEKYEQENITGYFRKGYKIEEILGVIHSFDRLAKSFPSSDMKHREEIQVELTCDGSVHPLNAVRYIPHSHKTSASTLWTKICTLAIAGLPLDIPHIFMEMKVKSNQEGYLFIPQRDNEIGLGDYLNLSLEKKEVFFLIDLLAALMKKFHHFGIFSDRITEGTFSVVKKKTGRLSLYLKNSESFTMKKEVLVSERKRDLVLLDALIKKYYPAIMYDVTKSYFKQPKASYNHSRL
jgi:hypothetical protein